jgi:hypothetical protein
MGKRKGAVDQDREARFYNNYLRHLPRVPRGAALKKPGVYFAIHRHDDWCGIYQDGDCNCDVE